MGILGPNDGKLAGVQGQVGSRWGRVEGKVGLGIEGRFGLHVNIAQVTPAKYLGTAEREVYIQIGAVHLQFLRLGREQPCIGNVDKQVVAAQGDALGGRVQEVVRTNILKEFAQQGVQRHVSVASF